jgi:hypothetical protein
MYTLLALPTRIDQVSIIKDDKVIATIDAVDYVGLQALQARLPPDCRRSLLPQFPHRGAVSAAAQRQRGCNDQPVHRALPPDK